MRKPDGAANKPPRLQLLCTPDVGPRVARASCPRPSTPTKGARAGALAAAPADASAARRPSPRSISPEPPLRKGRTNWASSCPSDPLLACWGRKRRTAKTLRSHTSHGALLSPRLSIACAQLEVPTNLAPVMRFMERAINESRNSSGRGRARRGPIEACTGRFKDRCRTRSAHQSPCGRTRRRGRVTVKRICLLLRLLLFL